MRVLSPALILICALGAALRADDPPADKDAARARVEQLSSRVVALWKAGKYAEAKPVAQEAVTLAEQKLGAEDPGTATSLNNLASVLQDMGDLKGAKPLYERALAIQEKVLGPEHPDTARSLNNLASVLKAMGDLKGAKPLDERALAIWERVLGPENPETANALNNLARVLQAMGDLKGAKPLYERALAIWEKALGADHLDTAQCLNNLATLLQAMGDLKGARPLYERALAIREKSLGADDLDTAQCLNNLATLLQDLGDLKGARPYLERALAITEKALGPDHPDTAKGVSNLATLLQAMGDLKGARPLYERALAIQEKALGPDHPDTATGLSNLAKLLRAMGDLKGAMSLSERALAIREKVLGSNHPDTARSLKNLAMLLKDMGDLKGARPLIERALAIREKVLGPDHPDTAASLNDLATLLQAMGDLKGARPLFERGLAIDEKVLGSDHPHTATSLNNLAVLLKTMGDLKGARPLHERALAIREKALGPDHPDTAASLNNLATLLQAMGDLKGGRPLFERAWAINRTVLHWLLPTLSSRERCAMVKDRAQQLSYYLSAIADDPRKTYSAACAWKGAALRASAAALRLPSDAPEEVRRLVSDIANSRAQLAGLALSSPTPKPGEQTVAEQYDAARKQVEEEERALAALLPDLAARAFGETEPADVQKVLPEGSALLDMLENCGNLHAWVVRPSGDVKYFPLGKAADLAPLAAHLRDALERDDEKAWKEAGAALREKVEKPLAAALEGTKTLYLSPDGVLATIPWGLLPDGEGFLIERLPIVCVGGGAWMVTAARTKPGTGEGLLAFGDVDYAGMAGVKSLPETRAEVQQVRERFHARSADKPCTALTGREATKAAFLSGAGKARYVHVATHGFFDLDNLRIATAEPGSDALRGWSGLSQPESIEATAPRTGGGWNPLLLSGILLAAGEGQDGVLTAEELQSLDLRGVDLVVLSACETGRGELAAGEGVLGLSRALSIAGARGFMLSLWEVPDTSTQELMLNFYAGIWTDSLSPAESLRRAQLELIARDREGKAFHPRDWGAWVLIR